LVPLGEARQCRIDDLYCAHVSALGMDAAIVHIGGFRILPLRMPPPTCGFARNGSATGDCAHLCAHRSLRAGCRPGTSGPLHRCRRTGSPCCGPLLLQMSPWVQPWARREGDLRGAADPQHARPRHGGRRPCWCGKQRPGPAEGDAQVAGVHTKIQQVIVSVQHRKSGILFESAMHLKVLIHTSCNLLLLLLLAKAGGEGGREATTLTPRCIITCRACCLANREAIVLPVEGLNHCKS